MKPSAKLIKAVAKVNKFSLSDLHAWSKFLRSLPIFSAGFTSNEELRYDSEDGLVLDCENEDPENIFTLHLDIEPFTSGQYALLSVEFFLGNRAVIAKTTFNKDLPKYLEKTQAEETIFGFAGTWEEVSLKLIRLSHIVGSQIPPAPTTE